MTNAFNALKEIVAICVLLEAILVFSVAFIYFTKLAIEYISDYIDRIKTEREIRERNRKYDEKYFERWHSGKQSKLEPEEWKNYTE